MINLTRKIGVIGMGHVGSTVAHYIVANGFTDDLVLIDKNEEKVNSDALDFQDAMPNLPFHTNIYVNDYSALGDADVIISAVGNIDLIKQTDGKDRFVELSNNVEAVKSISAKIKSSGFNGILDVITNPVDVITSIYQKETGLPKEKVIGTGTLLDSARMKRAVAAKLNIDSRSVDGYNLGEHGNSQFTAWSTVKVFGEPITNLVKENNLNLDTLDKDARDGGFEVFKGKFYTNYGVATAAVKLANAIISDAKSQLVVSNYRKEYGVYLSYPAIVGKNGIEKQINLNLTKEELEKLQYSADFINQKFEENK